MKAAITAWLIALPMASAIPAQADDSEASRPTILFNRWQEDWSVLANPEVPREPFDDLKYAPLWTGAYVSLGADIRERFEAQDAENFGVGDTPSQEYVISRTEGHVDFHWDGLQAFVQLQSDFAPGKLILTPVDQDRLDLEQAFVAYRIEFGDGGELQVRAGRQQIAFDLQRFISVRDGPNVRQSFDALWMEYKLGKWLFTGFYSQPVQDRDLRVFDDYSSNSFTYGGVHAEYRFTGTIGVSASISQFKQDDVRWIAVAGDELRNVFDGRFFGTYKDFDWDVEGMGQLGHIAEDHIAAWAIGALAGYTFEAVGWTPRLGLQLDAASGNSNPNSKTFGTFNPLFPNGYYVTLAGFTGYTNFVHVKPSITVKPVPELTVMLAVADQWRETTADAVYTQPDIPVAGTANHGSAYTGAYVQGRLDWQVNAHLTASLEAVRFNVAESVIQAGGHDGNFVGVESKFAW
jgi:hypothetical protein